MKLMLFIFTKVYIRYKLRKIIGIFGAGGFGREIIPYVNEFIKLSKDKYEIFFVEPSITTPKVNKIEVIIEENFFSLKAEKLFVIPISDYRIRKTISENCLKNDIKPLNLISDRAIVNENSIIGSGSILCSNVIITSNVKIGNYCHLNLNSYVGHDCIIGDFVTIAPNVGINGNVIIKNYAYIGAGSVIRNGSEKSPIVIGEGSIIGMGSVVTKNVDDYALVYGNPAIKHN